MTEDAHVLLEAQTSGQLNWTLDGPHGNVISSQSAAASDPAGKSTSSPLDLVSGNYTLSIQGVANATGTYQFQLLDLASAATATPDVQPATNSPRRFGQLENLAASDNFDDPLPDTEIAAWEDDLLS